MMPSNAASQRTGIFEIGSELHTLIFTVSSSHELVNYLRNCPSVSEEIVLKAHAS